MTCHLKKILFIGATIALPTLLVRAFIVINTTASLPPGIYYRTFEEPKRGDIVFVSPPDKPVFKEALKRGILSSGHSEAGTCHLIKIMAATDGDEIEIRKDGMFVNGEKMASSQRQDWQLEGIAELPIRKKLEREILLYTPHPQSFDSRYFGLVERNTVISSIKPLLLWN